MEIPMSVLAAARRWPGSVERARPVYRPDAPTAVINGMRHADAKALVADGVVRNDWRGAGDPIAINADDMKALSIFRAEIYAAWQKLQERLSGGTIMAA